MLSSSNRGAIELDNNQTSQSIGGLVGYQSAGMTSGANFATIRFIAAATTSRTLQPAIGQLIGRVAGGAFGGTAQVRYHRVLYRPLYGFRVHSTQH